jgi:hypothetical protein
MARKRYNVYLDEHVHSDVKALLDKSPERYSLSSLIEELLEDWYRAARVAPDLVEASPEERRVLIHEEGMRQFLDLADEIKHTLRVARAREEGEM